MKIIMAALIAFTAQASMAECLGEAQFVAKVESVKQTAAGCLATLSIDSITHYNESLVCSLDLTEVLQKGIEVGNVNQSCSYEAGQDISGVLVKNADGTISLD
jgi:hypothetical protein